MKKDSSTESWGNIEMTDEWIKIAQISQHRIHFIMPFPLSHIERIEFMIQPKHSFGKKNFKVVEEFIDREEAKKLYHAKLNQNNKAYRWR